MTLQDTVNLAFTILGSIGTAGGIVLALSSWLGKVWATRLMDSQRHQHETELSKLRLKLESENQQAIEFVKSDLTIFKEKHLKGFNEKIQTYRLMIDIVAEVLGDFDSFEETRKPFPPERFDSLNRSRIRMYGYIAMMAPQTVMDAQDQLIDYLLQVAHGQEEYVWQTVRRHALALINEVRKDIGIDVTQVAYNGKL